MKHGPDIFGSIVPGLPLRFGVKHASAAAAGPAWEQIFDKATADGWTALYDPTNPNTRTLSGSDINGIADSLGNFGDITPLVSAEHPTLTVGHFGDLDSGDYLVADNLSQASVSLTQPFSFLFLVQFQAAPTVNSQIVNTEPTGPVYCSSTGNPGVWDLWGGSAALKGSQVDTNAHVVEFVFDGASSAIILDDATDASGSAGTATGTGLNLNANAAGGQGGTAKHIGALVIGQGRSTAQRQAMRDLLHTLSGIAKA